MRLGTLGYYADFIGAFAFSVLLCVLAMSQDTWLLRVEWLAWFVIGIGLWTLLEYAVHRWLYHGIGFFIRLHDAHHQEPHVYIGAPPFVGIALIFVAIYLPLAFIRETVASGLTAGVLGGYLTYQLVHHATHFWQPPRGSYLHRARLNHSAHHYQRELGNFGITAAFWDRVFGTSIQAGPIRGAGDCRGHLNHRVVPAASRRWLVLPRHPA